jgi:hypothetical protein
VAYSEKKDTDTTEIPATSGLVPGGIGFGTANLISTNSHILYNFSN